jgi:hypothetical protein
MRSGFKVQGSGFKVGFKVQGSWFKVPGDQNRTLNPEP